MAQKLKLILLLSLLFACSNCWAGNYLEDANCIAAWLLDYDANPTVDRSVTGNDLSYSGTPVFTASGQFGGAYVFSASNQFVNATGGYDLPDTGFTMLAWAKTTTTASGIQVLINNYGGGGVLMAYHTGNSGLRFGAYFDPAYKEVTSTTDIYDSSWTHVVGVYNGSSVALFVNGTADPGSTPLAASGTPGSGAGQDIRLGAYHDGQFDFLGTIDEAAIFNDALNTTEINDIMDNGLEGAVAAVETSYGWVDDNPYAFSM